MSLQQTKTFWAATRRVFTVSPTMTIGSIIVAGTILITAFSIYMTPYEITEMHFLDQTDFNQWSLPLTDLGDASQFLTEELEGVLALIYNNECVGIQTPVAVELTITQTDPGIKGNSATGRTKPATLETGLVVQVPEYIKEGERIKVDTRTSEFLSRA